MTVDAVEAIKFAAKYKMPFDVVTNEELSGVPAYKAFSGMLIVTNLALRLGAKPILQPLFCYSPEVILEVKWQIITLTLILQNLRQEK